MAVVRLTNPNVFDSVTGNTTIVPGSTSSSFSLRYTGGAVVEFVGIGWQYSSDGYPYTGTLTGLNYYVSGQNAAQISGLFITTSQMVSSNDLTSLLYGGPDQVFGSAFNDVITPGTGNDIVIAGEGNDSVYGGDGDDDVNGNQGNDIVHGDNGADFVRGGQGNDTIYGDAGDDPHVNGNIGDDVVYGGTGNDTLFGGQGVDILYGEAGNDVLSGDLGNDILNGGAGADRFVLRAGSSLDWVADFKFAEGDRIQLTPGQAYTVTSIGNQVVIDIGNGDQIGLAGVTAGTFSADWIVYA